MEKSLNELISDTKKSLSQKNYDDALKNLYLIIKKDTNNLSALSTIGDIKVFQRKYIDAIEVFDKIIQKNPKLPLIYNNKGFCLLRMNKYSESIQAFQNAIQNKKDFSEAYNNLGFAFKKLGDYAKSKENFLKAIEYKGNYFQAFNNLTALTLEENNLEEASKFAKKSIQINQKNFEAYNNLGLILKKNNDTKNSLINFHKALEIKPNYLPTLINLTKSYDGLKDYNKAFDYISKALEIEPENVNALSILIYLKLKTCDCNGLDALKNKLINLSIDFKDKVIQPYYSLLLTEDIKFQKMISDKWSKSHSGFSSSEIFQKKSICSANKKIKLGYFSSDFENHAVASLLKDLFKNHNKNKFELFAFNLSKNFSKNDFSKNIIINFKEFIDCNLKTDLEIKNICDSFAIDIAIDLNGYTKDGRSSIFKKRCAPVQINYLGYAGTMGEKLHDYIIADEVVIPERNHKYYSEKIIFIPNSFFPNSLGNEILESKLTKKEFLLPGDKFIFCCFNNIVKINEGIIDIWSNILQKSGDSILWLSIPKEGIQHDNILKVFSKKKINSSRIFFSEKIEYQKYLERFQLADLFLDTYPYGGHTTSIEALSSGLPILTLQGEVFQSRVSASLLKNLELGELITSNKEDYIKLAIELSNNKEKINSFKIRLKNQKKISKIFNSQLYTNNLEKAYCEALDRFIDEKKIENIYI